MTSEMVKETELNVIDPDGYARAILNILADFSEEKTRLADVPKAMLNLLEDAGSEKLRLESTQKAILNILDDSAKEKVELESSQKAVFNILEDFDAEKSKVERINREITKEITERKLAEEEVRKYREHLEDIVNKLETANKDLEGFAYSVSHDLRVPLRAIDGFSYQVLKRYTDKLDDEGKRYLNVVRDNTKRMGQLIDDILAFSRMGRLEISMSEVDMEGVIREVFDELKPSFAGRELVMEIRSLPPCHGDRPMLRQVWMNLLNNAIKFTRPKAAALIEVSGYVEGMEPVYHIKDNGAGFDIRYADKLFGMFQRLHGIEEFEGTGIGLAIVKRIITRHGGRVWAEGKVNEGAIFHFSLPN